MNTLTHAAATPATEAIEERQTQAFLDDIFACLAHGQHFERIAGGIQTDVYRTGDGRYIVKLKSQPSGTLGAMLAQARGMRLVAEQFATTLGPRYSIPSFYVVARDAAGAPRVLVVQPFIANARPLSSVDEQDLPANERARVRWQLHAITDAALRCFRATGQMPDLYGSFSTSTEERLRLNAPSMWPRRAWNNLAQQSLLRSQNLVLTDTPERRVVLVDYDAVRWSGIRGHINDIIRWMLIWRDHMRIHRVARSAGSPV